MGGAVQADLAWHCHELRLSRLGDKLAVGELVVSWWMGNLTGRAMLHLLETLVFSWNSLILYFLSKRMRIEVRSMSTSQGRKVSVNYLNQLLQLYHHSPNCLIIPCERHDPFKLFVKTTELSGKVGTCSSQEQYPLILSFFRCCFFLVYGCFQK